MGDTKSGPFDIPGELAREWLRLPANPKGIIYDLSQRPGVVAGAGVAVKVGAAARLP